MWATLTSGEPYEIRDVDGNPSTGSKHDVSPAATPFPTTSADGPGPATSLTEDDSPASQASPTTSAHTRSNRRHQHRRRLGLPTKRDMTTVRDSYLIPPGIGTTVRLHQPRRWGPQSFSGSVDLQKKAPRRTGNRTPVHARAGRRIKLSSTAIYLVGSHTGSLLTRRQTKCRSDFQ